MGFLPLPADEDLSTDAQTAAARFQDEHPGPLTDFDRALLNSVPVFDAYARWHAVRDELVPYLGERAVTLFSLALSEAVGAAYWVAVLRRELEDSGDDPDQPQVTEAERLLLDWGRAVGTDPDAVPADLVARVQATFQPKVRVALAGFAGLMTAACVFSLVAGLGASAEG
jgi:hypothetical protein